MSKSLLYRTTRLPYLDWPHQIKIYFDAKEAISKACDKHIKTSLKPVSEFNEVFLCENFTFQNYNSNGEEENGGREKDA